MSDSKSARVVMTAPGLHVTLADTTTVTKHVVETNERTRQILRGSYPNEAWPAVTFKGLGPDTPGFCTRMADLQEGHAASLGEPTSAPGTIRARVEIAQSLEPAIQAATAQLELLKAIWAINLATANRAARDIYDRANVVGNSNAAVQSAIDPIRAIRGRAAKKAAMTRRRKREESAKKDSEPTQ